MSIFATKEVGMAIEYEEARAKINELNQLAIKIVDTLAVFERGTITMPPPNSVTLTPTQITNLKDNLKTMGDDLKVIAGEVKGLVKES